MAGESTAAGTFGAVAIKAAYDKYFEMALRHAPILREIADKRPVQVDKPGSSVTFHVHADLAPQTGTLTDGTDVTAVTLPAPTPITINLLEYGAAVVTTRLLREFSMSDVDPYAAEQVAYNMRDSLDVLFQTELRAGTNVRYAGTGNAATADVAAGDKITSNDVRTIVTKLRGNAAVPRVGDLYGCWLHPDVAFDLKAETGSANWRAPHEYVAPDNIWRHTLGVYEGAYFVESARMYNATDGTTSQRVYRTVFAGKQAVAEAVAVEPGLVIDGSPGSDKLRRLQTLGWYGVLGWKVFRQAALYRLESASTIV